VGIFTKVYDFMCQFGLAMRDDPPRVIDMEARIWGKPAGWAALSVELIGQTDQDALPAVSAVIRNVGTAPVELTVPGWLFFFTAHVSEPDGTPVALSPFGSQLLKPERMTERIEVSLPPGAGSEARLPVGQLFGLRAAGARRERYRVAATCQLPDGTVVRSNEILV